MLAGAGGGMQPSCGHDMLPLHLAAELALWLESGRSGKRAMADWEESDSTGGAQGWG